MCVASGKVRLFRDDRPLVRLWICAEDRPLHFAGMHHALIGVALSSARAVTRSAADPMSAAGELFARTHRPRHAAILARCHTLEQSKPSIEVGKVIETRSFRNLGNAEFVFEQQSTRLTNAHLRYVGNEGFAEMATEEPAEARWRQACQARCVTLRDIACRIFMHVGQRATHGSHLAG